MRGLGPGIPAGDRPCVLVFAVPQRVLQQDPEGVGQALRALEPRNLVAAVARGEGRGAHLTDSMEPPPLLI